MNKLKALVRAMLFPALYLLIQNLTATAAYGILYLIKRSEAPGLSEELLRNRTSAAYQSQAIWFSLLAVLLMAVFLGLFFRFTGTRLTRILSFRPFPKGKKLFRLIAIGIGANLALMGIINLIPFPESWFAEHSEAVSSLSGTGIPAMALFVLAAAPCMEEILYRGFAVTYLKESFSPLFVVLWQAVLFGAFHGTKLQLIYAFMGGLVLGAVYMQYRSLSASMVVHAVFNGISMLVTLAEWFALQTEGRSAGFWLIAGGAALLILLFSLGGHHLRAKKPDCDKET